MNHPEPLHPTVQLSTNNSGPFLGLLTSALDKINDLSGRGFLKMATKFTRIILEWFEDQMDDRDWEGIEKMLEIVEIVGITKLGTGFSSLKNKDMDLEGFVDSVASSDSLVRKLYKIACIFELKEIMNPTDRLGVILIIEFFKGHLFANLDLEWGSYDSNEYLKAFKSKFEIIIGSWNILKISKEEVYLFINKLNNWKPRTSRRVETFLRKGEPQGFIKKRPHDGAITWRSSEESIIFPIARREEAAIRNAIENTSKLPNQIMRTGVRMAVGKREWEDKDDAIEVEFFLGMSEINSMTTFMRTSITNLATQVNFNKNKRLSKKAVEKLEEVNKIIGKTMKDVETARSFNKDQRAKFFDIPLIKILEETINIKEKLEDILNLDSLIEDESLNSSFCSERDQTAAMMRKTEFLEESITELKKEIDTLKKREEENIQSRKLMMEEIEKVKKNQVIIPERWEKWMETLTKSEKILKKKDREIQEALKELDTTKDFSEYEEMEREHKLTGTLLTELIDKRIEEWNCESKWNEIFYKHYREEFEKLAERLEENFENYEDWETKLELVTTDLRNSLEKKLEEIDHRLKKTLGNKHHEGRYSMPKNLKDYIRELVSKEGTKSPNLSEEENMTIKKRDTEIERNIEEKVKMKGEGKIEWNNGPPKMKFLSDHKEENIQEEEGKKTADRGWRRTDPMGDFDEINPLKANNRFIKKTKYKKY